MLEAFANQQTDLTIALVISRTFDWTFLLKKVSSEHSLRLLYVLISYRNNSQRLVHRYIEVYIVINESRPNITILDKNNHNYRYIEERVTIFFFMYN